MNTFLFSFADSIKLTDPNSSFLISDLYVSFFIPLVKFLVTLSLNLAVLFYILLRWFSFFCTLKITLEWFPLLNPYKWPYILIGDVTNWYFNECEKVFPPIRLPAQSINLGVIIGLETLNFLASIVLGVLNFCTDFLTLLEKTL